MRGPDGSALCAQLCPVAHAVAADTAATTIAYLRALRLAFMRSLHRRRVDLPPHARYGHSVQFIGFPPFDRRQTESRFRADSAERPLVSRFRSSQEFAAHS